MTRGVRSDLAHLIGVRHGMRVVTGVEIARVGSEGRRVQRLVVRCDCGAVGSILPGYLGTQARKAALPA